VASGERGKGGKGIVDGGLQEEAVAAPRRLKPGVFAWAFSRGLKRPARQAKAGGFHGESEDNPREPKKSGSRAPALDETQGHSKTHWGALVIVVGNQG
jgi:hypothetical protein